jgi:hypothetical protein
LTRVMKKLLRELELPQGCPNVDPKAVTRGVNAALNADPAERRLYMRQKLKLAAVLTATVVALTGTALAVGPTLRDMITELLGSFAPYAQEVTGVSAVDQGIEIKATTAISDKKTIKVFLEVRDLEGTRITGDQVKLDIYASPPVGEDRDGQGETLAWVSGDRYLGYDPETRTALYVFEMLDLNTPAPGDLPLRMHIVSVQPGFQRVDGAPLPDGLLTDKRLASQLLTTGERVLTPGQTPAALEGMKGVSLSSIGFASDGLLHIQFKMPEGALEEHNKILPVIWRASGDPELSREYYNDYEPVHFQEGGILYADLTYPISTADLGDIRFGEFFGSFRTVAQIDGEWNLTVPLESHPARVITVNQVLAGTRMKTVSLSPIGADADTETVPGEKANYAIPGLPLTLYLKDGSVVSVEDRYGWTFDRAVDPNSVTGLAVGMWYMPLEGDTALPGYWLTELPQ